PVSIQREVMLDAARRVFMRDGYKASTALIAREAGVSEGSLFKHFKNKCGLFLAAMDTSTGEDTWEDRLLASVGRDNPQTALESAGIHILEQLRLILPRLMMVTSSGVTIPKHDHPGERPPPLLKMDVICRYFKAEIKAGRLAMASPQIQAHTFLGALSHYAWCETLFGYRSASPRTYVKTLVDTILTAAGTTRTSSLAKK
ncbi:MAG: TetR/AcrR family transcriptional regulator, partial [bacterium]